MPSLRRKPDTQFSTSSKSSRHSEESYESHSTAPTSIYDSPHPSLQHSGTSGPHFHTNSYDADVSPVTSLQPRSSTETYASTVASEEELFDEPEEYDNEYEIPEYKQEVLETDVRPTSSQNFADFFPSTRRLFIRHDDSTFDGNMNLRVDTRIKEGNLKKDIQLFHLRMHDLKSREFSLRRYCRESGREVCHSIRRYKKPAEEGRPSFQRSVSNAIANFVTKPEFKRTNSGLSTASKSSKRQDSGYGSGDDGIFDDDVASFMASEKRAKTSASIPLPTNTTKLEFSNYAQVDVKRRGANKSKRYEFEYWGSDYTWKRVCEKDGAGKAISYHLVKGEDGPVVAHIVPELRSITQMRAEEDAGGWVPPCSMWISDPSVLETLTDVAEVIVATGLIALVDDCIKRRWHPTKKPTRQLKVPLTPLKMDMEYVGPKALVEHMFKRRNSGGSTKAEDKHRASPLRFESPTEAH